jgi:endonuclease III
MYPTGYDGLRTLRSVLGELLSRYGRRFSAELGIRLEGSDKGEVFKWFIASILYGARISVRVASTTYSKFVEAGLTTPESIIEAGWDRLVEVLDSGGYARYDFKTATKLLEVAGNLKKRYSGDLNVLHSEASGPRDLEQKIKDLGKGVGDVTVNIFLREMREVWSKADPLPQDIAVEAAAALGLISGRVRVEGDRLRILNDLKSIWLRNRVEGWDFVDFESALVRYGLEVLRKSRGRVAVRS